MSTFFSSAAAPKLLRDAYEFADQAHMGQLQKYTGRPYIVHPVAVAHLVRRLGGDDNMIAAALLHDVREDCGVTRAEVEERFGQDVADLVDGLTDVSQAEDGNRAARKAIDREHTAKASARTKAIKACDLACNTKSIARHSPRFAATYLPEKAELLVVLADASLPQAFELAKRIHARSAASLPAETPKRRPRP